MMDENPNDPRPTPAGQDALVETIFAVAHACARAFVYKPNDGEDAFDLAQEVGLYCLAELRANRLTGLHAGTVRPFILAIFECRSIDRVRAATTRTMLEPLLEHWFAASGSSWGDPEAAVEEAELRALRERMVASLAPACRGAYTMVRDEEATYAEVAERLGLSRLTVTSYVVTAHKRFRRDLARYGIEPPPPRTINKTKTPSAATPAVAIPSPVETLD